MHVIRHQQIQALLRDRGSVRSCDLALELGVTHMTIWRDLELLAEQGLIRRVYGGAQSIGAPGEEAQFERKQGTTTRAKVAIARLAVERFVRAGTTIALEGGTTALAVVGELPKSGVTVLTNSLHIAASLRGLRPGLRVLMPGGWLSAVSGNLVGAEALRSIRRRHVDVCFLSATGFDADRGPTDPNPGEIEVKRALADASKRVVLLMDHAKFSARSASVTIHPRRLTALITDKMPPKDISALLKHNNVRVVVVGSRAQRRA